MFLKTPSLLLLLVLAALSVADDGVCPAGYAPITVITTITNSIVTNPSLPSSAFLSDTAYVQAWQPATTLTPSATSSDSILSSDTPPTEGVAPTLTATQLSTETSTSVSQTVASAVETAILPAPSGAESTTPATKYIGPGTRYGGSCSEEDCWEGAACSFFDYTLPAGIDGSTCISSVIFDKGANCGGCISVTYKGKTITVMVTNETGGNSTHLDMTPSTWAKLTNGLQAGGVQEIEWEWITCPFTEPSPLQIRLHEGTSKYWFAATVENAILRTAELEVSSDNGNTWLSAFRKEVNLFRLNGSLPTDTVTIRVTSVSGSQVVIDDVALQAGLVFKATKNY